MDKVIRLSVWVAILGFLAACETSRPQALSDKDRAAIEATSQAWMAAVRAGDWAALAAKYSEDAVLLPPNEPVVRGRANIQAWYESFPPITEVEGKDVEVEGRGDLAYVRGTYRFAMKPEGADPVTDTGKYLDIRRKQPDGSWLITLDMFSSDLPASP